MKKTHNGLIDKKEITTCSPWQMPTVGGAKKEYPVKLLNNQNLNEVTEKAKKEGYDTGYRQGYQQGESEVNALKEKLEYYINILSNPIQEINTEIEKEVLDLVLLISKEIVKKELNINPEILLSIIQEAKLALPVETKKMKLFLNIADKKNLMDLIENKSFDLDKFEILEDANLFSGEVKLFCEEGQVDGSLENRLFSLMEKIHYEQDQMT